MRINAKINRTTELIEKKSMEQIPMKTPLIEVKCKIIRKKNFKVLFDEIGTNR